MTSVLIVEDQRMPRENMEHLVEDSGRYRRVASLSTAEMALAQCARHTVDLVLMDVCTKGSRDGIDVAAEIKAWYPETKVIIITSMVEESYLKRAKAAGAESFWYKDVSPESLLEVMDRTMAGESLYPDRTPETRLGQVSSTQLTPREIEVLRLVCEGLEYEEIAAELGISSRTVKRFVSPLQRGAFFMRILLPKVPNCGTRRKYWKNFGQNTEKFSQFCPLWPMRSRGAVWYP